MTVIFKQNVQRFLASDLLDEPGLVAAAMVEAVLINQTEAFCDMIADTTPSESVSRAGVNEKLKGVKLGAQDLINDMIKDLHHMLTERLAEVEYGAAVTGIKYDLSGEVADIVVDVTIV